MRSSIVLRNVAAAKPQHSSFLKTKVSNGISVVAQDNNGAVSQLVLAFRAGSRYQSATQNGLVHHLRNFVGRDVQSYPGLQIVWSSAASGSSLKSFSSRDLFGVQLTVSRDNASHALSILGHVAARPAFKPWEFEDIIPTIKTDISFKDPYTVVFEDIHRAAFRNGPLSNSVYASKKYIGSYKSSDLANFAQKHFVSGNAVIVGTNVDGEVLKRYAEESGTITDGNAVSVTPSKYIGGDHRRSDRGNDVHIIVAGSGAATNDLKTIATQAVYLSHVGRISPLKFAALPGSSSGLGKLPAGVAGSAFQVIHEEGGLVGAYLLTNGTNADSAVRSTVAALRAPKVESLAGTKARAVNDVLFAVESNTTNALELAANVLGNGPSLSELISEINKVSAADVEGFAKKSFAKLSIASYGNNSRVPYSDEF